MSDFAPMALTLGQAAHWLSSASLSGEPNTPIRRVHTDTRSLQAGDLFVAIKGENFDGNLFLQQAVAQGAVAVLCEVSLEGMGIAGITVPDSKRALGELAKAWRAQFSLPVIAVTGSNGKTTLTQMIASILRTTHGERSWSTQGNFNNDIGLPLMLLGLRPHHRAAVFELGMNHPGEIAGLAQMCSPTVAVVNNAQREHQEFMASVEAVARENATVFTHLRPGGVAVFPAQDAHTELWHELAKPARTLTFGSSDAELVGQRIAATPTGSQVGIAAPFAREVSLQLPGAHNVHNALAAAACAHAAGIPAQHIAIGLSKFLPVKGRSRSFVLRLHGRAITVVDDSYNANPDSVRVAIELMQGMNGPRTLVLGDMGEVGNQGPAFHREVLAYAQTHSIEHVLLLGDATGEATCGHAPEEHFSSMELLLTRLDALLPKAGSVLVKGSNFMNMGRAVRHLEQHPALENANAA